MATITGSLAPWIATSMMTIGFLPNRAINTVKANIPSTQVTFDYSPKADALIYAVGARTYGGGLDFPTETTGGYHVAVGSPVTFTASTITSPGITPVDYLWDFGDGSVGVGNIVEHTFRYPGTNQVTLCVVDSSYRKTYLRQQLYPS